MPSLVDSAFSSWLKSQGLFVNKDNAALPVGLAGPSVEQSIMSPLATQAGANAEATRQMAFLGGPLAYDEHQVKGARRDLMGKVVTLTNDRLGYSGAGQPCFVFGYEENEDGTTILKVLRKLT